MPYEVHVAEDAPSERLVVSVGGKTLVYGEALESDHEAADAGELTIVSGDAPHQTEDTDLVSDLEHVASLVPEVAAVVDVQTIPVQAAPEEATPTLLVEVGPALDPPDQVVSGTSPSVTRTEVNVGDDEDAKVVIDPADESFEDVVESTFKDNENDDAGDA